jgi:hypothetical protein
MILKEGVNKSSHAIHNPLLLVADIDDGTGEESETAETAWRLVTSRKKETIHFLK